MAANIDVLSPVDPKPFYGNPVALPGAIQNPSITEIEITDKMIAADIATILEDPTKRRGIQEAYVFINPNTRQIYNIIALVSTIESSFNQLNIASRKVSVTSIQIIKVSTEDEAFWERMSALATVGGAIVGGTCTIAAPLVPKDYDGLSEETLKAITSALKSGSKFAPMLGQGASQFMQDPKLRAQTEKTLQERIHLPEAQGTISSNDRQINTLFNTIQAIQRTEGRHTN